MKYFLILSILYSLVDAKFIRNAKINTVLDTRANLMWQDTKSVADKKRKLNWYGAIKYCQQLKLDIYSDWRLPRFSELYFLANRSKIKPSIDKEFKYIRSDKYWSNTTYVKYELDAWGVNFYRGYDFYDDKKSDFFVRCVRKYKN